MISNKLNSEIQDLKEELLIAKRILKDPRLSQLASRKFNEMIEKTHDGKFLVEGALLTDLLEQDNKKLDEFEIEFDHDTKKLIPGTKLKKNSEMEAKDITTEMQFQKLNYNQGTTNSIKIRTKNNV